MTASSATSLWLAISLPRLPTDRLRRKYAGQDEATPLVVYAKHANAFVLTGVDAAGEACGLRVGMSLSDARAMQPAMAAVEEEAKADAAFLDRIAAWCERYGPVVVIDAPDGLFLEIGGSAHLFGGPGGVMADVARRLAARGISSDCAIAPTPGAAWALARWKRGAIVEADVVRQLADLPVTALRLEPQAATFLRRAGLGTIGQVVTAPRSVFAARAGERTLRRLDEVLGRVSEALTPRRPSPPVFAQRRLMEPIFHADAVLIVAETLIGDVLVALEKRDAGLKAATLVLFAVDGRDRVIGIGASRPERDAAALLRLVREKLNRIGDADIDLGGEFGFEAARLEVSAFERIEHTADALDATLAGEARTSAARMATLVDVLSARLGAACVTRPVLADAHQPEKQGVWKPALSADRACQAPPKPVAPDGVMRRPLTLFARPQPIDAVSIAPDGPPITFSWRRVARRIRRAEGPERITPDWLKADDGRTRDYYRAEDDAGRRYWLYREGAYGGETPPKWFIHGLFP